jgi:polygalacturonase
VCIVLIVVMATLTAAPASAGAEQTCIVPPPTPSSLDDTTAVQSQLATCAGGRVVLSPALYRLRPLFLTSNTTLEVPEGAVMLATDDPRAYERPNGGLFAFINAQGADDLTLEGGGVIDGNGSTWWVRFREQQQSGSTPDQRPRLIDLDNCSNVHVQGLTLQNSPSFHLVLHSCDGVEVNGVTIRAPADSPNTDGIDPMASHHVHITGSTIDTGDDDVAIKSAGPASSELAAASSDIVIEDCTFVHGHGVSIGSESSGGVRGVRVANSTFRDTDNGIRIKTNRDVGGLIEGIRYVGLRMDGVRHPIAFAAYYPSIPSAGDEVSQPVSSTTPRVSRVSVSRVTATGAQDGGWIIGLPEQPFERIRLSHVAISAQTGLQLRNVSIDLFATATTAVRRDNILVGPSTTIRAAGLRPSSTSNSHR